MNVAFISPFQMSVLIALRIIFAARAALAKSVAVHEGIRRIYLRIDLRQPSGLTGMSGYGHICQFVALIHFALHKRASKCCCGLQGTVA